MTAPLLFRLAKPEAAGEAAAFSGEATAGGAEEPQVHSVKRPQWSEGKRPKPRLESRRELQGFVVDVAESNWKWMKQNQLIKSQL